MTTKAFFIFFLLTLSFSFSNGQTWLWGKISDNKDATGYAEALYGGVDACNNFYLNMYFAGTLKYGNYVLSTTSKQGSLGLVKYDPNGNVLWANQVITRDSNSGSEATAFTTDRLGNYFFSEQSFDTGAIYQGKHLNSISPNAIVKCDYNGNVIWISNSITYFFYVRYMTTDNKGFLYACGGYDSTLIVANDTLKGGVEFLIKYSPSGNVVWLKNVPLLAYQGITGLSVDKYDNIYASGGYGSLSTEPSFFKFDSLGNLLWTKNLISYGSAWAYNIIADNSGNLYMEGAFNDTLSLGGKKIYSKWNDAFLTKCDTSGNAKWLKALNVIDTFYLVPYGFANDNKDNLYLTGSVAQMTKMGKKVKMLVGTDTLVLNDVADPAFIEKFDSAGNSICVSLLKSGGDDLNCLGVDSTGNYVYLGGDILDTTIFGKDTINYWDSETPFAARWEKCQNDVVLTLNGCNIYECIESCKDSAIVYPAGGTPPYTYEWNTNPVQTTQKGKDLCVGLHRVLVKDSKGDSSNLYISINTYQSNPVSSYDTSTIKGQSVQLSSKGGIRYSWAPPGGLSCDTCPDPVASPSGSTTYTLTMINDTGCMETKLFSIDVRCGDVFVPDAFSPNGDGYNDVFYVRGPCIHDLDFTVFDRWGNKVFETTSPGIGWDGKYRGSAMNAGTYVYYMKATMDDGTSMEKKGNITLVR